MASPGGRVVLAWPFPLREPLGFSEGRKTRAPTGTWCKQPSQTACLVWAKNRVVARGKPRARLGVTRDLSASEHRRLLRGCFQNLGRLLGVFSQFANANPQTLKRVVDCEGLEHLDAAQRGGRGVILFTGHVGAWELTSFALSLFDHPLSFLVRRIDNPKIEKLIAERRERLGNRTIDKRLRLARPISTAAPSV